MAGDVRERMVEGAVRLLALKGLEGTSFTEVLELTGAPRGSLYHHFPEGKDQLIAAAIELAGQRALSLLDHEPDVSAKKITEHFLGMWRALLTRSHCGAGCAVLAVTVASPSPALLQSAGSIFRGWRERLTQLFERSGLSHRQAVGFAALLVASSEGAVVLSRAEKSSAPFELVAEQLIEQIKRIEGAVRP
jgi:AcrR family transcriptional regulator